MVGLSFVGCLALEVLGAAILLFAREKSQLKKVGSAIVEYSSWAVFALPVFILVSVLTENLNRWALMSYVYPIGAGTLCIFVSLYLKLD